MRLKLIRSQAGVTLLEVMIALGILSVVSLTLSQVMIQSLKLGNNVKVKEAVVDDSNLVRLILANSELCKGALRTASNTVVTYDGKSQKGTSSSDSKIQRIVAAKDGSQSTYVELGLPTGDITYKEIYLGDEISHAEAVRADGKTYTTYSTNLVMESKANRVLMGPMDENTVSLPISVTTGPGSSKAIVDCSSFIQPDLACVSLGGTYDPTHYPPCLMPKLGVSDSYADRDANTPDHGLYAKGNIKSGADINATGQIAASGALISGSAETRSLAVSQDGSVGRNFSVLGRLGIGKSTAGAALDVEGKILASGTVSATDSGTTVTNKTYVDTTAFAQKGFCNGTGQLLKGYDKQGNPICGTVNTQTNGNCPAETYLVGITSAGASVCEPVSGIGSCGANKVMVGVNSNGQAICGAATPGPKGDTGATGAAGPPGPQGPQGPRGVGETAIQACTVRTFRSTNRNGSLHCCPGSEVVYSWATPADSGSSAFEFVNTQCGIAKAIGVGNPIQFLCCR